MSTGNWKAKGKFKEKPYNFTYLLISGPFNKKGTYFPSKKDIIISMERQEKNGTILLEKSGNSIERTNGFIVFFVFVAM